MCKAATAFLCLFFLLSACAFAEQLEEIEVQISTVSKFIEVDSNINFSLMLPGQPYDGTINISWAVPSDALNGIGEKEVEIFFSMAPKNNESIVKFVRDGAVYDAVAGSLKCVVESGECGEGSRLSESVGVQVVLNEEGKSLVEVIVVNASLKPTGVVAEIVEERKQVLEEIREVEGSVVTAGGNAEAAELVEEAKEKAGKLDVVGARKALREARAVRDAAQKKKGLLEGAPLERLANTVALGDRMSLLSSLNGSNFMWILLAVFLLLITLYVIAKVARKIV